MELLKIADYMLKPFYLSQSWMLIILINRSAALPYKVIWIKTAYFFKVIELKKNWKGRNLNYSYEKKKWLVTDVNQSDFKQKKAPCSIHCKFVK